MNKLAASRIVAVLTIVFVAMNIVRAWRNA